MKHYFSFTNIVFALAITVLMIGFLAFSQKQKKVGYFFQKEQPLKDNNTDMFPIHNITKEAILLLL